jgi:hypothetical protein
VGALLGLGSRRRLLLRQADRPRAPSRPRSRQKYDVPSWSPATVVAGRRHGAPVAASWRISHSLAGMVVSVAFGGFPRVRTT